jgi:hypothetical protein
LKGGVTFAPGVAGKAFRLDGAKRYVEVPASDLWGFGRRDFSIELSVQFRALRPSHDIHAPSATFIACSEGTPGRGYGHKWVFAYGGGFLYVHIHEIPDKKWGFYAKAAFSPDVDQWYHLALTRSRGTFTMYVNGAPVASEKSDIIIPNPDAPLTIGQHEGAGGFFSGLIDEVAIYDRALSADEVKDRWSALAPAKKQVPDKEYVTLPIDKVASAVSTKSLFTGEEHEHLIFPRWGKQEVFGIPFDVIDPKGDSVTNAIVLYGPHGERAREMPTAVKLKCGSQAKAIHLLSGVAAWGGRGKTVCVIVRLHYRDGGKEDHELINGVHFCDYNLDPQKELTDVPGSRLAMRVQRGDGRSNQIRYLAIQPKHPTKVIEEIEFIKGMKDVTAPVIMAVTVERPAPAAEKVGEVRKPAEKANP